MDQTQVMVGCSNHPMFRLKHLFNQVRNDEVLFESNVQYDNITVYFYFSADASTLTNTSV